MADWQKHTILVSTRHPYRVTGAAMDDKDMYVLPGAGGRLHKE